MKYSLVVFFCLILTVSISSCNKKSVSRIDPNSTTDLSGRWNDTDSRLVSEEMVKDALNRRWLEDFNKRYDKRPTVIVGVMQNKSHEHINMETFVKDIEREFINSGMIRVVQSAELRTKLREEKVDQQQNASVETQKRLGKELGADFMMFGVLNTIVDEEGKKQVVFYQTNLELVNIETNEKVWLGDKKIKKYIKKGL